MANKPGLDLHPKPKQPIEINRILIITIAVAVVMVVLLAIISAFTTQKIKPSSSAENAITEKPFVVTPEFKGLPENYSDINAIKKYLPESPNHELASLIQQFNELKNAYTLLQRELSAGKSTTKAADDPKTSEAKRSGLVFSGLSSGVENLVGGGGAAADKDRSRFPKLGGDETTNLVPSEAQANLFKKQTEDEQKIAVMKGKDKPDDIYDLHNITKPVSKYQIQAGTLLPATLITAIDTTFSGTVVAQFRQNVYDTVTGKYLLIPRGSKLLGEYENRALYGQTRISMAFTRIIRPDGTSILLGKPYGSDTGGRSGTEGNVDNHWAQVLGAATISAILSFGAGMVSDRFSNNSSQTTARQSGFLGAGQQISGFGTTLANRAASIPPVMSLPSGTQFNVTVKRDMVLNPYKARF